MQQIRAALPFARQIFRGVARRQVPVRGRVPLRIIHAVQNTAQVRRAPPQHAVQFFSELRRLNLLGIFPAHRGQHVGVDQPALEEIEVIELLQFVHGEDLPGKQQPLRRIRRKPPLIAGVVNGQHHSRLAQHRVQGVHRPQVHRNQRRLPVVYMKHLRNAQQLRRLQHRPAKQPKPLPVVRIVARPGPVKPLPVKELRAIHKVVLHPVPLAPVHNPHKPVVVFERNGNGADRVLPLPLNVLPHRRIQRQVHRNPSLTSSGGNAPTTSASPPVLANGAHSEAANTMCIEAISQASAKTGPNRPERATKGPVYYAHAQEWRDRPVLLVRRGG